MSEHEFEYGPVLRTLYVLMIWPILYIGWAYPDMVFYYVCLWVFLGLGLRIVIEKSGLYEAYQNARVAIDDKRGRKRHTRIKQEVDRKMRDEKYRKSRYRDPRLPKNW